MRTDAELLLQALGGREEAFGELYRRRQSGVYRFALHMTGSVGVAEDVTQESFLILLTRGEKYDELRGSLAAFLCGIARNLVMRRLERELWAEPSDEMEHLADGSDMIEDLERRESVERVRRAVLSLPSVYREVVALCDLQESSYEEAAQALDCPVGTVRSRLNRARGMLARKLRVENPVRCIT